MLYEVDSLDPVTFGAVTVFVIGVGMLATLLPARRAIQVDPIAALRTH